MVQQTSLEQGDRCAICRKPFGGVPQADHKHFDPPQPRGLLCKGCNTGLGHFQEDPAICRAAAEYLENWGIKQMVIDMEPLAKFYGLPSGLPV
jgi:hypothetical protein